MKKSNPFVAIPTVPSTISGQWLTFTHMANHYRKLLNVKPRVETFAPKGHQALASAAPKSLKKKTERKHIPSKSKNDSLTKDTDDERASSMIEFQYQLLSNALKKDKVEKTRLSSNEQADKKTIISRKKHDPNRDNLQESLRRPTPAVVLSDSEAENPLDREMGVSEKIRLYLDQMHHFDSANSSPRTPTLKKRNSSGTPTRKSIPKSQDEMTDAYHARHSNCFIPYAPGSRDPPKSPKIKSKSNFTAPTPISKASIQKSVPKQTFKNENKIPPKAPKRLPDKQKQSSPLPSPTIKPKLKKNTRCKDMDELLRAGLKKKKPKPPSGSCSPASGSIGTIHGSEVLTAEPLMSKSMGVELKTNPPENTTGRTMKKSKLQMLDQQARSAWLNQKADDRNTNSYDQSGTKYSKLPLSKLGFGIANNKDSSRDSAYEFSSGESRITTRESTPEKIADSIRGPPRYVGMKELSEHWPTTAQRYKSSLSTVDSSINQDYPPTEYSTYRNQNIDFSTGRNSCGSSWLTESKYINFLTAVTNDIVTRGIYTNKGLKTLFHSHVTKNKDLELDKMTFMLDRLRMDVGIPKDDSLNNLEFGYGSVKYSKGPFFSSSEKAHNENETKVPRKPGAYELEGSKSGASDLTILELHRPEYHSEDESSKMSSCIASVLNGLPGDNRKDQDYHTFSRASSISSKTDAVSPTASEIRNALMEVGFDPEATLDIVQIVGHSSSAKRQELNNNKVDRRNYSEPNISNPR